MIVNTLVSWFTGFFTGLINLLPTLPSLTSDITNTINSVLGYVYDSIDLINLFIPVHLVLSILFMVVAVMLFKYTWSVLDWVLRHIPVFGTH